MVIFVASNKQCVNFIFRRDGIWRNRRLEIHKIFVVTFREIIIAVDMIDIRTVTVDLLRVKIGNRITEEESQTSVVVYCFKSGKLYISIESVFVVKKRRKLFLRAYFGDGSFGKVKLDFVVFGYDNQIFRERRNVNGISVMFVLASSV